MDNFTDELRRLLHRQYGLVLSVPPQPLSTNGGRFAFKLHTAQGTYVVKVTAPDRTTAQVEQDLAAFVFLERHAFPAPRIVRTREGHAHFQFQDRHAYVYTYINGQVPPLNEGLFRRFGTLLGRLHRLPTSEYPHSSAFTPVTEFPLVCNLIERHLTGPFAAQATELLRDIAAFPSFSGLPQALIHSDVYYANLLQDPNGELHLIDLDDAGVAPALIDVGYVVANCCTLTRQDRQRLHVADAADRAIVWRGDWAQTFLQAYQQIRPLTAGEKKLLPHAASFALLAYMIDWDTGAFLVPNYERYHLLKRVLPQLVY